MESTHHWQEVYRTKDPSGVSWYQEVPSRSLEWIVEAIPSRDAAILDAGGGASSLVDHLLDLGYLDITVLDISAIALEHARKRLGRRGSGVQWLAENVLEYNASDSVDLWHDRAVLHFLTRPDDQRRYGAVVRSSVRRGGWALIAGFAPGGPTRCSGLDVVQHDRSTLEPILGPDFELVRDENETHITPTGSEQLFAYHLFRRRP